MREATELDIPRLMALAGTFYDKTGFPGKFDEAHFADICRGMIESPSAVIFITRRGMIGGFTYTSLFDPSWISAAELFWWSEDGKGKALLDAFEAWASSRADDIVLTSISKLRGETVGKLFERRGYERRESSYHKVI